MDLIVKSVLIDPERGKVIVKLFSTKRTYTFETKITKLDYRALEEATLRVAGIFEVLGDRPDIHQPARK